MRDPPAAHFFVFLTAVRDPSNSCAVGQRCRLRRSIRAFGIVRIEAAASISYVP